jgi:signal transduction histidine kinase
VRLVWRVAQEAVRNAVRHSGARHLRVAVAQDGAGRLRLEVTDDGAGFDPGTGLPSSGFGLRGLASLVADAGGRLDVTSAPGQGTTVLLITRDEDGAPR